MTAALTLKMKVCTLRVSILFVAIPALLTVFARTTVAQSSRNPAEPVSNYTIFLPAQSYGSGGTDATSIAVGDVNGDGKPDVLVVNDLSDTVAVLLGNGNGTFQTAQTYFSGGVDPTSVAVGDFNGDGNLDIVVTSQQYPCPVECGAGVVSVLLGKGKGTFQPAQAYGTGGSYPIAVVVADVNGDGKPDLLVSNQSSGGPAISVLIGNGDGTFQAPQLYDTGGFSYGELAAGDLNEDGKLDIVTTDGYQSVIVLLGNGDGSFQAPRIYSVGGIAASSVAISDVNGDGIPDLLVTNETTSDLNPASTVAVLLGKGDGTFQMAQTYPSGGVNPVSIAVTDVNGDGKPDVLVAHDCSGVCSVSVLRGNGNGSFQAPQDYDSAGSGADSIAVADLDGNGSPDVVVANSCVSRTDCSAGIVGVLLNARAGTAATLTSSLNPSVYGQVVTWTATVTTAGSLSPSGQVNFNWTLGGETYAIGSGTLNSNGVATITRATLNADLYPMNAVYVGDANNLGSSSPVLSQIVQQATSSATITSSPNPSTQGQSVTFTATITSPTAIPTGPVTFTAGKTTLGSVELVKGKATLTTSTLPLGSNTVTVTYPWNSDISSSSASLVQTVQKLQ